MLFFRALYKEEQEVVSRRITAILSYILTSPSGVEMFTCYENRKVLFESIEKICDLLDSTVSKLLFVFFTTDRLPDVNPS